MAAETMDTTPTRRPVWLRDSTTPPLADVFRSIPIRATSSGCAALPRLRGTGLPRSRGLYGPGQLTVAHSLLSPLLGTTLAPVLFGVALLACGLNSTVTATMAGEIVMEGFIDIRMAAWARRLLTRLFAIAPAIGVILVSGEAQMGKLLVLSEVVPSFQLPFAVVPLVMFTASQGKLRELVSPRLADGDRGDYRDAPRLAQCEADLRLLSGAL